MTSRIVALISGIIFIAIIAWDIWLASDGVPGNTISDLVWEYSKYPAVPAFIGFAMGALWAHWFWQR